MAAERRAELMTQAVAVAWRGPQWRRWAVLALCFLPWAVLLAWHTSLSWFLTDDAFISFRYVRNLLEGHGLVFNPGEYVEGYSNFLWVLELAALWGLFGLRPEQAAPWLSVAYTVGTLAVVLWWAARAPGLRHRRLAAWMVMGLLCSSATFAAWTSGGGLETRQFTFFVVLAVVCLLLHGRDRRGLVAASLALAAAALTRPEGPLIAACCFAWYGAATAASGQRWDWRKLACLAAPFVALVAAHFLFRYAYYGEWLPNTYYAKHVRLGTRRGSDTSGRRPWRQDSTCGCPWRWQRFGGLGGRSATSPMRCRCYALLPTWSISCALAATISSTALWISTGRCWRFR